MKSRFFEDPMRLIILWQAVHHKQTILALLEEDPERIRIATLNLHDFYFDGVRFSEKIVGMANRGVSVTIVLGENPFEMAKKAVKKPMYWEYLKSLKRIADSRRVNAYWHPKIHAKLLLTEKGRSASAIVTSANFTPTGLSAQIEGTREAGCYLRNLDERSLMALREATNEMIELARRNPLKRDLDQILG